MNVKHSWNDDWLEISLEGCKVVTDITLTKATDFIK
jgi:hypothetical protein